jgi:hypothetical protein
MSALEIAALKVRKDYCILNDGFAQCGHSIKSMFHNIRWPKSAEQAPMLCPRQRKQLRDLCQREVRRLPAFQYC